MAHDPADGLDSLGAPSNVFYFVRDLDGATRALWSIENAVRPEGQRS